jgi:hypothetical protein
MADGHITVTVCARADEVAALVAEVKQLRAELQYARDGLTKGRTRMREDIEHLRAALILSVQAMRAPLDDWKGELERKALDAAALVLGPNVGANRHGTG